MQYHYINENYGKGIIEILKVDSNSNLANMLTMSLDITKVTKIRKELRLI